MDLILSGVCRLTAVVLVCECETCFFAPEDLGRCQRILPNQMCSNQHSHVRLRAGGYVLLTAATQSVSATVFSRYVASRPRRCGRAEAMPGLRFPGCRASVARAPAWREIGRASCRERV